MIFSVRRPQYLISHTKSQRSFVTRQRISCEKSTVPSTVQLFQSFNKRSKKKYRRVKHNWGDAVQQNVRHNNLIYRFSQG